MQTLLRGEWKGTQIENPGTAIHEITKDKKGR